MRTIKLPSGKTADIRDHLTAAQARELRLLPQKHLKMTARPGATMPEVESVDIAAMTREEEDLLITFGVAAHDGQDVDILNRILNNSPEDYAAILEALQPLKQNPIAPKQPASGATTSAEEKPA